MRCVVCRWRCQTAVRRPAGHRRAAGRNAAVVVPSLFAVSTLFLPFLSKIVGILEHKAG